MNPSIHEPFQDAINEMPTAGDAAGRAWETTREKAGEAVQAGERYVRENPGTSALGILGFGFLLGFLVGWSVGHEQSHDYGASSRRYAKGWGRRLNLF